MDKKFKKAYDKVVEVDDLYGEVLDNITDGKKITFTPKNIVPNDRFLLFSAWKSHKVTFHWGDVVWLEFNHDEPIELIDVPKSFLESILLNLFYERETA